MKSLKLVLIAGLLVGNCCIAHDLLTEGISAVDRMVLILTANTNAHEQELKKQNISAAEIKMRMKMYVKGEVSNLEKKEEDAQRDYNKLRDDYKFQKKASKNAKSLEDKKNLRKLANDTKLSLMEFKEFYKVDKEIADTYKKRFA